MSPMLVRYAYWLGILLGGSVSRTVCRSSQREYMNYKHPEYLIEVEQLQALLAHDSNVRVFDASVLLHRADNGYTAEPGIKAYLDEHIPGAGFIDLLNDWSDTDSPLNNTLLPTRELAAAIGNSGINAEHKVVLYSSGHMMWATRAWWCLHYAGHPNIAVLNGNLSAWRNAGLPTHSGMERYAAESFSAEPNRGAIVSTLEVEQAIEQSTCIVNALSPELYAGIGDFYYQRRGHIPTSLLLHFDSLLSNEYFLPAEQLSAALSQLGMLHDGKVITYCGGGIAATIDAFACKLLGQHDVAVYDGSMSEWVQSPDRALTLGNNP